MKKKLCALICTIAVLSSMCVPIASADGGFSFTQSFDDVVLEDGTTDLGAVSEAIGLDVTVSNSFFPNEVDGRFAFTKTEDGKLKIVGTNIKIGTGLTIAKDLEEPVKIGIITMDMSLSEIKEDGDGQWRAARLYDSENSKWTQRTDLTTGTHSYKFHVVYSRTAEDEPWKEERTITTISATGTESTTTTTKEYTAADFDVCTSVLPITSYLYNGNASIVLDDIHIEVARLPVVKSDDDGLAGAEPFAEEMAVGFDAALPNPADKVTLVKKDDADVVIETQTQYDEASKRLTVKPLSFLTYGTKYTLKFANGGVANHTFETKAAPVKVISKAYTYTQITPTTGTPGDEIPQQGTFNAEAAIKVANTTDGDKTVDVIFVAYDEKGAIVDSSMLTKESIPANTPDGYPVSAELSNLNAGEALRFEAFVFESSPKGGYLPLV